MQTRPWLRGLNGESDVDLLGVEEHLDLMLACLLECEPEAAALFVHASEEGGEVLTLDEFWGGDAQAFIDTAGDTSAQIGKTGEEGLDVVIEDLALARELKGAAVE
jgi:hypothetical protein